MSEQMGSEQTLIEQKLVEHADDLIQWVKAQGENAGAFVSREAPLLIQEILTWGMVNAVMSTLLSVALAVFSARLCRKAHRYMTANSRCLDNEEQALFVISCIVLGGVSLVFVISAICNLWECVYIMVAPRLYLLDTLSNLIK